MEAATRKLAGLRPSAGRDRSGYRRERPRLGPAPKATKSLPPRKERKHPEPSQGLYRPSNRRRADRGPHVGAKPSYLPVARGAVGTPAWGFPACQRFSARWPPATSSGSPVEVQGGWAWLALVRGYPVAKL